MKEELYQWMKNLAVLYILFTAVLHLVPDKKYERYVRSFMGLLLIYMFCTPVMAVLGKSSELIEYFNKNYQQEKSFMEQEETENLQAFYLNMGYEEELSEKIKECLADTGIKLKDTAVNIEGERITVVLYIQEETTGDKKGRIYDVLRQNFGIEKENCQIVADKNEEAAVDRNSSSGTAVGSNRNSGFGTGHTDICDYG